MSAPAPWATQSPSGDGKISTTRRIQIVRLPPVNFMPVDGTPFTLLPNPSFIVLPAVGGSAIVLSGTVPRGRNGIIKRVANVVSGGAYTDGSGAVVFQILLNISAGGGIVAPYFDNITASIGLVNAPSEIDGLRVQELTTFGLLVKNVSLAGGPYLAGGRLDGYFYPIQSEPNKKTW